MKRLLTIIFLSLAVSPVSNANDAAPWGQGQAVDTQYNPQKVVYDVAVSNVTALERVLDRASYLNTLYHAHPFEASIVLVSHGDEIEYFAIKNYPKYKDLMRRAQSLTVGGTIKIRMCEVAARQHGYKPGDIHGFVEFVPMADAEIVRLQTEEGHAYMQ